MNRDMLCSDEELNRFVDGQLHDKDRRRLERHLAADSALAEKVRQYRSIDQALRDAYDDVEPPQRRMIANTVRATRRHSLALAALLLPLGMFIGWIVHANLPFADTHESLAGGISLPADGHEQLNALFHIDVDERTAADELLDRVETILTAYDREAIQVEVVANAAGLNLLREDRSAVAQRVSAMMDKYDNLMFLACANTIQRLAEKGESVRLIGRTHASETAIDHVVNRLRAGWTYVKI
jgi:intracellular sulfur oxidation DsrE/DsrF family protein